MELQSTVLDVLDTTLPVREPLPARKTALMGIRTITPGQAAARRTLGLVLAAESALQRAALGAWLSADPSIEVIAKVTRADDAAAMLVDAQPDVLILMFDHSNHPFAGLASRARRLSARTRVVVLSAEHDARSCRAAAECGASAHVTLADEPQDLLLAVRGSARSAHSPAPACVATECDRAASLSGREKDVLVHLSRGLSAKQAAAVLGICPKTVDNHTQRLMKKLDLHSRADVVRYAVREGYVKA